MLNKLKVFLRSLDVPARFWKDGLQEDVSQSTVISNHYTWDLTQYKVSKETQRISRAVK